MYRSDEIIDFLSNFDNYDHEMKMSVCRAAFELNNNIPPWEAYFFLAEDIGYVIPKKWEKVNQLV